MVHEPSSATLPTRAIVIGASNVTRGMATVAATAGALLGTPLTLMVAAGRGRSFGTWSRVLARAIPSILDSGLWRAIESGPVPGHALVTDVGNDVIYGRAPQEILRWVDECLGRLRGLGTSRSPTNIVLARIPIDRLERVGALGYSAFRYLIVPGVRTPPLAEALRRAREVHEGLADVARAHGATLVDPALDWYGIDPIHLRFSRHALAWRTMLGPWSSATMADVPPVAGTWSAAGRLVTTFPQCGAFCGIGFGRPDGPPGRAECGGVGVELY